MSKKRINEQGSLSDRLNADIVTQLKSKKTQLKQKEEQDKERERQRKIEERKKKEANKSFEELLEESEMDWKKFK
ncbi:YqkE family protein [Thalassobacillus sp. B23F22_16]|uniref:YqkE family protein n=1 Tax=Thalassobacillus sp. B23F22_16 TaxID=3459513 RepID=UPI00373E2C3E